MRSLWSDIPKRLVTSGDMSSDITSDVMHLRIFDNVGLHVEWSGSPVGIFSVWGSNKETGYTQLELANMTTYDAENPFLINLKQFPYMFLVFKFIRISGSGTLNVYASAKGFD